ncbi:MAG: restriction endonuclease subunit S [Propionicimonas sp.]
MSDDWQLVVLGDLVDRVRRRVDVIVGRDYPAISVLRDGSGLGAKDPFIGGQTNYSTLFEVHAGDVVVRTITAFEAPVAVACPEHHGTHVSQVFLTYTVRNGALPEYLRLVFQTPAFWEEMRNRAQGTVLRRKTISDESLRAIPLTMPPLEAQRRIVDLFAAVDASAEALAGEAMACAELEGPLVQSLVARGSEGMESLPLGDVGEFVRGRRFTKAEYVPSGLGCIHYGQIHTHFGPVARKSLTFLPEESRSRLRLARPGDVVIAATSEDVDGLGKATVWLGDDDVAVHDDCYIFRHMLDPKFASYVFASPWFQHQKRQYAGGTKVTRISGADLARIAVPIPPMAIQVTIGEALGALSDHVNAAFVELDAVRHLRMSLLTGLLSRRVEIPEAYDYLVDAGVA